MSKKNKSSFWVPENETVISQKSATPNFVRSRKPNAEFFEPSYKEGDEFRYKIQYESKLCMDHKVFTHTNTTCYWTLKIKNLNGDNHFVELINESQKTHDESGQMNQLIEFAEKFNEPTKILWLALEKEGSVRALLNQPSIYSRWEKLKKEEMDELVNDTSTVALFMAAEEEFRNTLPSILNNMLYVLFFNDVYQRPLGNKTIKGNPIHIKSQMFPQNLMELENKKKIKFTSKETIVLNEYKGDFPVMQLLTMENEYNNSYKELMKSEFEYDYWVKSKATYSNNDGALLQLKGRSFENAAKGFFQETIYEIERITNQNTEENLDKKS